MKKITFIIYIISIIFLGILGAWIGAYAYKINSIGMLETPVLEGMENKDLERELAMILNEGEDDILAQDVVADYNQYYLLKESNGFIVVYKYDDNGELIVYQQTNIATEYLTDADRQELEKGIEVFGNIELSSRLEDYV